MLAAPLFAYLAVVFVLPLSLILVRSFTEPQAGFGNYSDFFSNGVYVDVLINTFVTAFAVSFVVLAIGYPFAYLMTLAPPMWRTIMFVIVLLPFWTSLLIRSLALVILLRDTGVINESLQSIGLTSGPIPLMRNFVGVVIGMTQILLPFMVLPLYATMRGIDRGLLRAAEGLGARPVFAFWRVYAPLSLPGVYAGLLLCFVQALGYYITPALLGSSENVMLGELIVQQVSGLLRWGFASALAVILLAVTLLLLFVVGRFVDIKRVFGGSW